MPGVNPLIDLGLLPTTAPAGDPALPARRDDQSPVSTAPYTPLQPGGGGDVNPYEGTVNDTNAAGTQESLAMHVAIVILVGLVGVYALRALDFKFVVAAGVGGGGG